MTIDLRCRHSRELRERAADMFAEGHGKGSVAKALGISKDAVRQWQQTYRSVGRDGLLNMGKTHAKYDYETKVAAARAVVEGVMTKSEVMKRFGIVSQSPLNQWCQLYRDGGAEALRPRSKGRPRKSSAKAVPMTREQELEREVRRLEAHVAYLKKSIALKAARDSAHGSAR